MAVYVALSAPARGEIIAIAAILAVALGLVGIAGGRLELVQWTAGGLAAAYVGSLLIRSAAPDQWSPLVAVDILLSAELASWSIDSRRRGQDDLVVHLGRLRWIALGLVAALALVVVLEAAEQLGGGGTAAAGLATIAVLVGVGAVCMLMWRSRASGLS